MAVTVKPFSSILLAFAAATAAHAEMPAVKLRYGLTIPAGWVDGLSYSLSTQVECGRLLSQLPADVQARVRCLTRPSSLPPMS